MGSVIGMAGRGRPAMFVRLANLIEMSRKDIQRGVDGDFIHHTQYTKELPKKNTTGCRYHKINTATVKGKKEYNVIFKTNSATSPGSKTWYQEIILLDLKPLINDPKDTRNDAKKVIEAITKGDILVGCDCEAFLFWGYAYIARQLDIIHPDYVPSSAKGRKTPDVRNSTLKGVICKHIDLALQVLPFNASSIAKDMKELPQLK